MSGFWGWRWISQTERLRIGQNEKTAANESRPFAETRWQAVELARTPHQSMIRGARSTVFLQQHRYDNDFLDLPSAPPSYIGASSSLVQLWRLRTPRVSPCYRHESWPRKGPDVPIRWRLIVWIGRGRPMAVSFHRRAIRPKGHLQRLALRHAPLAAPKVRGLDRRSGVRRRGRHP